MFLETMVVYPPVVSVEGFANVDRGLFRAVSNLTKLMECCKKQFA
jgi:16S rRNA G527 N7-methylase RsmG